jgi:hypothetical protein
VYVRLPPVGVLSTVFDEGFAESVWTQARTYSFELAAGVNDADVTDVDSEEEPAEARDVNVSATGHPLSWGR